MTATNPISRLGHAVEELLRTLPLDDSVTPAVPALKQALFTPLPTPEAGAAGMPYAMVFASPANDNDGDTDMALDIVLSFAAVLTGEAQDDAFELAFAVQRLLRTYLELGLLAGGVYGSAVSVVDFKHIGLADSATGTATPYQFVVVLRLTAQWIEDNPDEQE